MVLFDYNNKVQSQERMDQKYVSEQITCALNFNLRYKINTTHN